MSQPTDIRARHARSSRQRYRHFVRDYRERRLDDRTDEASGKKSIEGTKKENGDSEDAKPTLLGGKRREYLREYLRWLWPHRYAVGLVFVLALIGAGLQMVEPLFMRYIIDRVLLNTALDAAARLTRLNLAGAAFLAVDPARNLIGVLQGLPPAAAEHARDAVAAPVAVRPAAAPAAAEAVGHEDRRHPVAPHRRRGHDDRAAADGDRLAVDLGHPAAHRRSASC